jgi:hypothetical protein
MILDIRSGGAWVTHVSYVIPFKLINSTLLFPFLTVFLILLFYLLYFCT